MKLTGRAFLRDGRKFYRIDYQDWRKLMNWSKITYVESYRVKIRVGLSDSKVLVAQLCPILCNPLDCSLPGSSCLGFSRQDYCSGLPCPPPGESSWPEDRTWVSCIVGRFLIIWATRETHNQCWVEEIYIFPLLYSFTFSLEKSLQHHFLVRCHLFYLRAELMYI